MTASAQAGPGEQEGNALRSLRSLPGPRRLPVIGNLLQIEATRFHQIAEQWCEQYGSPFRIQLGRKHVVVVDDPEIMARVLRERPATFGRGLRIEQVASEMGISGLFTSNAGAWLRQRPMVMSAFAPTNIKRFFPSLIDVTQRLERRWRRAATSGADIDLQADLMRYTVDVTAGLAFGAAMNTLESGDNIIQDHLNTVFPMVGRRLLAPIPYWRWFKLARDRRLERSLTEIHRAVADFIAQARARMESDPARRESPGNLIEAMIAARDAPESQLDDQDVAGNVLTMLLAGEDTTANTLAWLLQLASQNVQVQQKLCEESDRVLGDRPVAGEFADAANLVYAEACTHEAMRLRPVAPLLVMEAFADTEVAGVRVPKGALVMLLTRRASTDPKHFDQPLVFLPERWLDDGYASGKAAAPKRVSMPFGGGPRLCPGRYLALLEIKMVVAMLFRNFKLVRVAPEDDRPVRERLSFTMEPVGLLMRLALRERR